MFEIVLIIGNFPIIQSQFGRVQITAGEANHDQSIIDLVGTGFTCRSDLYFGGFPRAGVNTKLVMAGQMFVIGSSSVRYDDRQLTSRICTIEKAQHPNLWINDKIGG